MKVVQNPYMSSSFGAAASTVSFPIIPIALLKNDRISLISIEHILGVYQSNQIQHQFHALELFTKNSSAPPNDTALNQGIRCVFLPDGLPKYPSIVSVFGQGRKCHLRLCISVKV